jgi:hypothetical protein
MGRSQESIAKAPALVILDSSGGALSWIDALGL